MYSVHTHDKSMPLAGIYAQKMKRVSQQQQKSIQNHPNGRESLFIVLDLMLFFSRLESTVDIK